MRKKTYAEMRAEGLCTKCGKPNPTPDKSVCPECSERRKAQKKIRYEYMKRIGKCVRCGKNDAEPGKTMCLECAGKESDDYFSKYREKKLEYCKAYDAKRRLDRKANGICVYCGKRPADTKSLCVCCKAMFRKRNDARRNDIVRSERVSYGICYICGKNPVIPGKGVCLSCYNVRVAAIQKCNDTREPGFNDYWKGQNKLIFKGGIHENISR